MCASLNYVLRAPFNVDVYDLIIVRVAPSDNFYFVVLIPWDVKLNFGTLISVSNQLVQILTVVHQEVQEGNFKVLASNFIGRAETILCFHPIAQPSVCISNNAVDQELPAGLSHLQFVREILLVALLASLLVRREAGSSTEQVVFGYAHPFSFRQCSSLTYTDVVKQSTVLNCLEGFD